MAVKEALARWVAEVTQWAANGAAPVMPWLFLALRRALIPTLGGVVLAVFFFVVPQSREVLDGLSEPVLTAVTDFNEQTARMVNVVALCSYLLTATVLALALWYCTRLLVTVEADQALPTELRSVHGSARLRFATRWLPRMLGVGAECASVGAMLYANYTPRLTQWPALGLVAVAVGGPIVFAAGALLFERDHVNGRFLVRAGLVAAGAVLTLLAGIGLHAFCEGKWRLFAWSFGATFLPALLLVFFVRRRHMLAMLRITDRVEVDSARGFGEVIINTCLLLAAGLVALACLAVLNPPAVRSFGSAACVLLFLSATVMFMTASQLVLRRISRNVPGLTTAIVIVGAAVLALRGREAVGTEKLVAIASADPSVEAAQTDAAPARPPIYINAYGGGLRAAVFTAEILARADDATCGEFGDHLAVLSGVSGGSVGIATYLSARQQYKRRGGWHDCIASAEPSETPLTNIVTQALVQDHLSTVIARLLAVDVLHVLPNPLRGQALLDSWQTSVVSALHGGAVDGGPAPAGLALALGDLSGGIVPKPRVYFNATDADTGDIVWFSNADHARYGDNLGSKERDIRDLSVGLAVLHSARFPVISPAGSWPADAPASSRTRLVDGGYADNSGDLTLLQDLRQRPPLPDAIAFDLDGNPPPSSRCFPPGKESNLDTGIKALLQARSAHARLAASDLRLQLGRTTVLDLDVDDVFNVPPVADPTSSPQCERVRRARQAPLGWYVSYSAARLIDASTRKGLLKMCSQLAFCPTSAPNVAKGN